MIPSIFSPWRVDARLVQNDEARLRVLARARELYFARDQREKARERRYRRLLIYVFGFCASLLTWRLSAGLSWSAMLSAVLPLLVVIAAAYGAYLAQNWFFCRRYVRQALRELGDEPCVACGYQLRGLPRKVIFCPECGAVRVFEIRDEAMRPIGRAAEELRA